MAIIGLGIAAQIYGLLGRVDKLEERSYVQGKIYVEQLTDNTYRIKRLEEICCEELK